MTSTDGGAARSLDLTPGTLLAGKYRVEGVIGRGGMGVVVAARHLELDEVVAIKLLEPAAAAKASTLARFRREGRAASRIKNDHVARILDVDALEDGVPYIVMEHLTGVDLAAESQRRGPLPLDETLSYVLQACEAVAAAHAAGIIHRDLKPGNLFLANRPDGSKIVKVLDFGISKMAGLAGSAEGELDVTTAFETLGSPIYMSPEQMRSSRDVDARTDIWSLGVILFKLLTGSPPFPGTTVTDVCARILTDATPSVLKGRPDLPPGVDAVIGHCLAKDPAQRLRTVGELAFALGRFASPDQAARVERIVHAAPPVILSGGASASAQAFLGSDALVDREVPTLATDGAAPAAAPPPDAVSTARVPGVAAPAVAAPATSQAATSSAPRWIILGALGLGIAAVLAASLRGGVESSPGVTAPSTASAPPAEPPAAPPARVEGPLAAAPLPVPALPVATGSAVAPAERLRTDRHKPRLAGSARATPPAPAPDPPPAVPAPPQRPAGGADENPLHL